MTTTKAEPKGLHAKLAEVMAGADRIPKNGKAPAAMGGFDFVQVGDAADAIRKALGDRGVSMLPSAVEIMSESEHPTQKGGTMTTQTVRTTWTLVDGETGQTATIQSLGTGADTGDKFSPKAQTNAMKYALLMGFLLSTGDDPEQVDTSDRQQRTGDASEERLELLGRIKNQTGVVKKGDGQRSNLDVRQTEDDGMVFGFRLENIGGQKDKHIAQVVVDGNLGAVYVMAHGDPAQLVGKTVTVSGLLYAVRVPQRRMTHRLLVETIATDEWTLPAPAEVAEEAAPSAPAQDDPDAAAFATGLFTPAEDAAIDKALESVA